MSARLAQKLRGDTRSSWLASGRRDNIGGLGGLGGLGSLGGFRGLEGLGRCYQHSVFPLRARCFTALSH